ncbi:ComEC/Rec2 family competence protein [Pedobacter glucosidilyticus]|uniref:ComEC/Rec2 family competence protein n=1 Tax=Pedobacter glucosidilyticus TaxID=1122941 RepID=UPI0026EA97E1|nr:ComEC/Rec2 family competence protein [Pedobacter glucosidilyticus]
MIAYFKGEIPFFRYLWFFIIGISLAIGLAIQPHAFWCILWISNILVLMVYLLITKYLKLYQYNYIPACLIALQFIFTGIILCNSSKEIYQKHHFSKHQAYHHLVIITEQPKLKGDIARFTVSVKHNVVNQKLLKTSGNLLLAMRYDTTKKFPYRYGDLLLIKSKIKDTEPAYNPAEFNYKRFLAYKQIYHQSFINLKETVKLASEKGNPIISFALKFREKQVEKFKKYLAYEDSKAVASTLILGYRADLDPQILQAYSNTGTLHILSVSGMHVAIVVLLLNLLFKPLEKLRYGKIVKLMLMLGLIWFYALITGLAPSILRAALMLSLILIAKYQSIKTNIFNVIGVAAFVILIINPFNLMDVGFQLSFLAVMALVYLQPIIYHWYQPQNKILDWMWQCASVSIAAQIATTPISLYYFHQFPLYFIISNLYMAIPAIIIMYGGIGFLLIAPISDVLANILGAFLNQAIYLTNKFLILIEQIPYANITQVWLYQSEIILMYIILLLLLIKFLHPILKLKIISSLTVLLIGIHSYHTLQHIQQEKIVFFTLRKNTAVALLKGRTATLFTDLNPDEYTYKFSVKPYLDSCRITKLSIINTQTHKDYNNVIKIKRKSLKIIRYLDDDQTKYDWLLLSGDKIFDLPHLAKLYETKSFIIDGKNKDYKIENMVEQAQKNGIYTHVLKRKPALEINL